MSTRKVRVRDASPRDICLHGSSLAMFRKHGPSLFNSSKKMIEVTSYPGELGVKAARAVDVSFGNGIIYGSLEANNAYENLKLTRQTLIDIIADDTATDELVSDGIREIRLSIEKYESAVNVGIEKIIADYAKQIKDQCDRDSGITVKHFDDFLGTTQ